MTQKNRTSFMNGPIQEFLDFRGFDFRDFLFNVVYDSILFSLPLVLLSMELQFTQFLLCADFFMCPHINSVNRGMPVFNFGSADAASSIN